MVGTSYWAMRFFYAVIYFKPVHGIAATLFERANQSIALKNCGALDLTWLITPKHAA